VPASTGLGSSSTFCVGLLNALYKFKGEIVSAGRLAEQAAHIECDILKRPMGKQDHYAAAFGGLNYIRFYDDETVTVRPVNMTSKNLKKFSDSIIIFWTGLTRPSESILKEQNEKNSENAETLGMMRDQAFELSKLLMNDKYPIQDTGEIIHNGWRLKKSLTSGISNIMINNCYETALEFGALGGKLSGAGGGGFLTLLAKPSSHEKLAAALAKKGLEKYSFGLDSEGTTVTKIS
jgi:D-glycero-alpha-D-manno-heptose-7-phosphate kinase